MIDSNEARLNRFMFQVKRLKTLHKSHSEDISMDELDDKLYPEFFLPLTFETDGLFQISERNLLTFALSRV